MVVKWELLSGSKDILRDKNQKVKRDAWALRFAPVG